MSNPELSIVVPAHNEELQIRNCIDSICLQIIGNTGLSNTELIVVANACTDNTLAEAQAGLSKYPDVAADVVATSERGKKNALNMGLFAARSGLILCVDADCIVAGNSILEAQERLHQDGTRLVSAEYWPELDWAATNRDRITTYEVLRHTKRAVTTPHKTAVGRFMGFYREDLPDGFSRGAAPDDLLLSALVGTRHGLDAIDVSTNFAVDFKPPTRPEEFVSQMKRYSIAKELVLKDHPETSEFFAAHQAYCDEQDGDDMLNRWRDEAMFYGVDFDKWYPQYLEFLAMLNVLLCFERDVDLLPTQDMWDALDSTKGIDVARS